MLQPLPHDPLTCERRVDDQYFSTRQRAEAYLLANPGTHRHGITPLDPLRRRPDYDVLLSFCSPQLAEGAAAPVAS